VSGKKTAQAVIAWVNAQGLGLLTDEQSAELNACAKAEPKVDNEFVSAMEAAEKGEQHAHA
jgi:hypothetical protein